MDAAELAAMIAQHFESVGYPFPGKPEVHGTEKYPVVVVWDDNAEITRVIGCCVDESELANALLAAEGWAEALEKTNEAPCGTVCHAAWTGGFINSEAL